MDTHHQPEVHSNAFSDNLAILIEKLEAAAQLLGNLQYARPSQELMGQWRELIKWLGNLSEHGLQMAVLGSFSSGKSTLINALLQRECLPVGVQATTATMTRIRRSREGRDLAHVRYKAVDSLAAEIAAQLNEDVALLARSPRAADAEAVDLPALPGLADIVQKADKAPFLSWLREQYLPDVRRYLQETTNLGSELQGRDRTAWQMGRDFLAVAADIDCGMLKRLGETHELKLDGLRPVDTLRPVLTDEQHAICVEEVSIALRASILDADIEIIDTPGLGSVYARHTRRAKEVAKAAHLVAYVFPEKGPGDSDLEFLSWMHEVNEVLDPTKVFWVVNMVDRCIDDEARDAGTTDLAREAIHRHQQQIAETLAQRGFQSARIFPVSAACANVAGIAAVNPSDARAQAKLARSAIWLGDGEANVAEQNLDLSGVPKFANSLQDFVARNGARMRRAAARQRILLRTQNIADDCDRRLALSQLDIQNLQRLQDAAQEVFERVKIGRHSEVERTRRNLRGLVEDLGRMPLMAAFDAVLDTATDRISETWNYDANSQWEALCHAIGKPFRQNDDPKRPKSKLEKHAAAVVTEALRHAMDKHNTRDVFESIHDDMRGAISIEFNDSLKRILDELSNLEVRSQSGRQIRIFHLENRVGIQAEVIEDTLDNLKDILFRGFGLSLAGGAVAADFAFTGGLVSAVIGGIGVVAIFIKVARKYVSVHESDPDARSIDVLREIGRKAWADIQAGQEERRAAVQREFRKKLKEEVAESRGAILEKAIDNPLRDYQEGLLEQYQQHVRDLLNSAQAQLERAREDIASGQEYHGKLRMEIGDVKGLLLELEHGLRTWIPEPSA